MSSLLLPELSAMQSIAQIVADLTPAERRRIAAWFYEYASQEYDAQTEGCGCACQHGAEADEQTSSEVTAEAVEEQAAPDPMESFESLYQAIAPKTGMQKAVVAGYWLQRTQGQESWKASEVNKLLKQIDVKVSSISIVLTNATKMADPLIEQLGRLGDGERSRKTFCLTQKGWDFVGTRLA